MTVRKLFNTLPAWWRPSSWLKCPSTIDCQSRGYRVHNLGSYLTLLYNFHHYTLRNPAFHNGGGGVTGGKGPFRRLDLPRMVKGSRPAVQILTLKHQENAGPGGYAT